MRFDLFCGARSSHEDVCSERKHLVNEIIVLDDLVCLEERKTNEIKYAEITVVL